MKTPRAFFLWVIAGGLAGCYDELPNVILLNNTGHSVVVVQQAADGGPRIEVGPSLRSRRIVAYGTGRRFDIVSGDCTYKYVFPAMGVNYAWRTADGSQPDYSSHFPVLAQLEPDLRVYLLPPGTKAALTGERLAAAQGHRFPIAPVDKNCPQPTSPSE